MDYKELLRPEQLEVVQEAIERNVNIGLDLPMGYGKTLISIILGLLVTQPNEKILMVCEKSVVNNFIFEIEKFFGNSISYYVYHYEYHSGKSSYYNEVYDISQISAKIVITTTTVTSKFYKSLRLENNLCERIIFNEGMFGEHIKINYIVPQPVVYNGGIIYGHKWGCLIVDEFHNISNITSENCRSLLCIPVKRKYALSGTLLSNVKLQNMLSYFMFIENNSLGINTSEFSKSITSDNFEGFDKYLITRKQLNFQVETIQHTVNIQMFPEEEIIYKEFRKIIIDLYKQKQALKGKKDDRIKRITSEILSMISKLRLAIVSPLIPMAKIYIDVANAIDIDETLFLMSNLLNNLSLVNYMTIPENLASSRISKFFDIAQHHEKIVVFSSYRKSLDYLEYFIKSKEYGINRNYMTILGEDNMEKRSVVVNRLQTEQNYICGLTYELGGVGLNLQNVNCVIFLDYDWDSVNVQQALARVVRQGQTQVVNIYYLVSNTGIEAAILKKQLDKKMVAKELREGKAKTNIETIKTDEIVEILQNEVSEETLNRLYKR